MSDLCTWFGLKHFPFDKQLKTKHILDTEPQRECAARLSFIKRRGGILLLTGDPGVGKTLAMRHFVESLNDNLYRTVYTPLSTLSGADLLRHINQKLNLTNRASKSSLYLQIQQELLDSKELKGKTVVLIIDEAHLLKTSSLQELRLLTNFRMDSYDPFILILCGQSDLKRLMDFAILEPFAQRLAMRFHMPPLQPDETHRYLQHHMALVGAHEPIFSEDATQAIFDLSFGIPRKVGLVATQALTYAMFTETRTVDADIVLKCKTSG